MERMPHTAIYGNVKIPRGDCPECKSQALILDKRYACCGYPVEGKITGYRQMSGARPKRVKPNAYAQSVILQNQDNKCRYCKQAFGEFVWYRRKPVRLSVNWDHLEPYVYGYNNQTSNFVAACQACNGWKGAKMFDSIEEIEKYVQTKWARIEPVQTLQ